MSYCVQCGVELDPSAKKCPLCSTPVINPNVAENRECAKPYPDRVVLPPSAKRRFTAFIVTMVMLIPNIVCFLVNLLFHYDNTGLWLLNASSILIWIMFVFPLILHKSPGFYHVLIDGLAATGYLYVISCFTAGRAWLTGCAIPLVLIVCVPTMFLVEWIKRIKPKWPSLCIAFFSDIFICSIPVELIVYHYVTGSYKVQISIIVMVCCAAIIGFFIAVATNRHLRMWMSRKFFVE